MGLTPEERRKIYQEEKARIESARDEGSRPSAKAKVGRGVLFGCLGILALFVVLVVFGSLFTGSTKPKYDERGLLADINSSAQIQELGNEGIIQQVQSFGTGVSVVVGPRFYTLSFEEKKSVLQTVANVVGSARGGDHFVLYDWQTDKKVGSYSERWGLNLE